MREAATAAAASIGLLLLAPGRVFAAPLRTIGVVGTERRYAIPAADGVQIDADHDVILARSAGRVYAFSLACPHKRTALRWEAANNRFRCPKHKSTFRPDGTFIDGKATRPMDRFAVRRDGDAIIVDVDRMYQHDEMKREWESAFITLP